ncbi:hypothetical protein INR49_004554 [Caranx melampygus]|nr:hypothetical protein INR49_004554 [Caranx melampygus]
MEVYYFRKQATRHYGTCSTFVEVAWETRCQQTAPSHSPPLLSLVDHIQARVADMSELLGRQDCIESLRRDLVDLQGVIVDVFSRTGPVRFSSWKFPDKPSCNLDMVALLGQYDFMDGEDAFNQHSHVVLLELMIDRLLLLLQSFNSHIEQMQSCQRREQPQQKGCLSVGLVVRNYWSNLVQFANFKGTLKDIRKVTNPKTLDHDETKTNHMSTSPTNNTLWHPEADSQTVGSTLSCCRGHPGAGADDSGDVAQWANEQVRDMRRLAKHLQDVRGTVRPLKDRLETAETERERFRSQLEKARKDFKREMEKHQATIVQLEFSLHKAQRSMKETEQRLLEEQHQLKTECEKKALQEKVESLQLEEEASCKLQQRIQQLEREISETQVLLDKEKAKYQSACRLQESMQAKQKSLLERVNALDEECEELQMQLGERERDRSSYTDMRLELQKEKQALETNTGNLKNSVTELKEYVQALKERERLLVAFPELSPLAQAQPQSTGNVLLDMEQQLQANSIRIKVLEQENATLQTSLEKLKERAQHNAAREAWALQTTPVEKQQNHLTLMQSSPLQSSSATRLGYSNSQRDARAGESGWESAESEDRVSTAAASPLSLQIHLQTLHLNTPRSTAAKSYSETRSAFLLSHSRGLNKRRNKNPEGIDMPGQFCSLRETP